jgi:hypothetical protein
MGATARLFGKEWPPMRTAWTIDFEGRGSNYTGNRALSITVRRDAAMLRLVRRIPFSEVRTASRA